MNRANENRWTSYLPVLGYTFAALAGLLAFLSSIQTLAGRVDSLQYRMEQVEKSSDKFGSRIDAILGKIDEIKDRLPRRP